MLPARPADATEPLPGDRNHRPVKNRHPMVIAWVEKELDIHKNRRVLTDYIFNNLLQGDRVNGLSCPGMLWRPLPG
jgi:hypothetical protein